jgi:hypothetical protein
VNVGRKLGWVLALLAVMQAALPQVASAQGIYEELKRLQDQPPPSPPPSITREQLCEAAEQTPGLRKCRVSYVREGYKAEWRGIDRMMSHPLAVQILTRGNAGVLCFEEWQISDWAQCIEIEKAE